MADILRVTAPLVQNQHINPAKQPVEVTAPFNLSDVTRVAQPQSQSELLKQNNSNLENTGASNILTELLKSPSTTISFLRGIYLLRDIINLIPANNSPLTAEIEELFSALMLKPEEMVSELLNQEFHSTIFKGELFDVLRQMINLDSQAVPPESMKQIQYDVAELMKALNQMLNKQDVLDSLSNHLSFLGNALSASKNLSERIETLMNEFRKSDASENFETLKKTTMELIGDIRNSILLTPKTERICSILTYNLSRFSQATIQLDSIVDRLSILFAGESEKAQFKNLVKEFIQENGFHERLLLDEGKSSIDQINQSLMDQSESQIGMSKVMKALSDMIQAQAGNQEIASLAGNKLDQVIQSLITSPSNFTPLLHFVLPVQFEELDCFAEMWVDQEKSRNVKNQMQETIHCFIVFDIQNFGKFETEIFAQEQLLTISIATPSLFTQGFKGIEKTLAASLRHLDYRMDHFEVKELKESRTLMDVFKNLSIKRSGLNVKI